MRQTEQAVCLIHPNNRRNNMNFKKLLAASITLVMIVASFVCPVTSQEASSDLPLLISPNPNANEQQTEEVTEEAAEEIPVAFSDIPQDAPYKAAIDKLVKNGVLSGYPDGTFRPAGNLTRAEMCKMINLTFGYTDTEGAAGFPDLKEGEWYIPYVLAAQKAGYITGDAAGTFRPGDNISRQEVCVILCRIIKPYDLPIPVTINDKVDDWARPYVETIVKNGLMPLEEGGTFRATEAIKRSELASTVAPHSNVKVEDIKCTVTFKCSDEVFTEQVVVGKTLETKPVPTTPAPEGMMFGGWVFSPDDTVVIKDNYMFVTDTVLYAYFVPAQYTVQFKAGTSVVAERTAKHGETTNAPASPEMSGFTFKGWALDGTTDIIDVAAYKITQNTVFVAVFAGENEASGGGGGGGGGGAGGGGGGGGGAPAVITYKVLFKSGTTTVSEQTVNKDAFATVPANPIKENYDFAGWALTENGVVVAVGEYAITADTTFYAVFKEAPKPTFKVDFISAGNKVAEQTVKQNECAVAPGNPVLANHEFIGWSLTENGATVTVGEYAITADTTFYAVFKAKENTDPDEPEPPKTFKVVFMSSGSKVAEQTVNENAYATVPGNPSLDKHKFKGWSLSEGGAVIAADKYKITADTTFYAVFERVIVKYTVEFVSNGKTVSTQQVEEDKYASAPSSPTLSGYTFKGWALVDGGTPVSVASCKITSDTTFYAVFERIIPKYTVKFLSNGKTVSAQLVEENKYAYEPAAPELENHIFAGWALKENGSPVSVEDYEITSNTTFYAVFTRIINKFNVTFVSCGEEVDLQQVEENDCATEPAEPELDGYVFVGWALEEYGDVISVEDYEITEETTFYAVYELPDNPNDPDLILALKKASQQFGGMKFYYYQINEKKIQKLVVDTLDAVVAEAESGVAIDRTYIKKKQEYRANILEVKKLVKDPGTSSTFISDVAGSVDEGTYTILTEYFLNDDELEDLEEEL